MDVIIFLFYGEFCKVSRRNKTLFLLIDRCFSVQRGLNAQTFP